MSKVCLLCPTLVPAKHRLCYPCYRQYKHCMHEPWFLALAELQKVQDRIDEKEQYTIDSRTNANLYGNMIETPTKVTKKAIGRPKTNWKLVDKVLELYDTSIEAEKYLNGKRLSLRAIAKLLDNKVKFVTVRRILLQYRRDVFLNRRQDVQ